MLLLELLKIIESKLDVVDMKDTKHNASTIAKLLFKVKAGPVIDKKRSKEPIFWGVTHTESTIKTDGDSKLKLTFDNSTDSGEFEINSLAPLEIEKGSPMDKAIRKLYSEYKISSSKKTGYTLKNSVLVLREVHLGKMIQDKTIDFVKSFLDLLKTDKSKSVEEQESK